MRLSSLWSAPVRSEWSLTSALAVVEPEIWSTTPFVAAGLVRPVENGPLRSDFRARTAANANVLAADQFPRPFARCRRRTAVVTPLRPDLDPARGIDSMLAAFEVEALVVVPLQSDGDGAMFWVDCRRRAQLYVRMHRYGLG